LAYLLTLYREGGTQVSHTHILFTMYEFQINHEKLSDVIIFDDVSNK